MDHIPTFRKFPTAIREYGRWISRRFAVLPFRKAMRWFGGAGVLLLAIGWGYNLWAESSWQRYKAEAGKRGVSFYPPASFPKRVAPIDNFAAEEGVFAATRGYPSRYISPLEQPQLVGVYSLSVRAIGTDLNLKRAEIEFAKAFPDSAGDPRPVSALFLERFDQLLGQPWNDVLRAEAKPLTQYRVSRRLGEAGDMQVPGRLFNQAADFHHKRATAQFDLGKPEAAFDEILGQLRLIRALATLEGWREMKINCNIVRSTVWCVWYGLHRGAWDEDQLVRLSDELRQVDIAAWFHRTLESERAWFHEVIESQLNCRLHNRVIAPVVRIPNNRRGGVDVIDEVIGTWDGALRESQRAVHEEIDAAHHHVDGNGVWRLVVSFPRRAASLRGIESKRLSLFRAFGITTRNRGEIVNFAAVEVRLRQAIIALAIERYRLAHEGALPISLEELCPAFLDSIPADPYNGGPMGYRVTGANFVLWSVGDNGLDEQGTPSPVDVPASMDIAWPRLPWQ